MLSIFAKYIPIIAVKKIRDIVLKAPISPPILINRNISKRIHVLFDSIAKK